MKPSNGSIKYRNRRIYINWRGENAQHVAENYISSYRLHPFLHVQIQKYLQRAEICKKGKNIYGLIKTDFGILIIPIIIESSLAHIKTAYIMSETDIRNTNKKAINGFNHSRYEKWRTRMTDEAIENTYNEMGEEDAPDILDGVLEYLVKRKLTLNPED